jgi:hypothetical protein
MLAGVDQVIHGVACRITRVVPPLAELYADGLDGVNVTDRLWVPAFKTAPEAGEYENVPGTVTPP